MFGEQIFRRGKNGVYLSGAIKYLQSSRPVADQDGQIAALHLPQGWHAHPDPGSKQRLSLVPADTLTPQPGAKILQFCSNFQHRITN
jgi:hypothetical protein